MSREQCIEFFKNPKEPSHIHRAHFVAVRAKIWPLLFCHTGFLKVKCERDDYLGSLSRGRSDQHIRRFLYRITQEHGEGHPDVIEAHRLFLIAPHSIFPALPKKNYSTPWD